MNNQIYPCLWFDGNAAEAAHYYCGIFKDSFVLQNNGLVCTFTIQGAKFMALNGGPQYKKNGSISFFVYCGSIAEIDRIYAALMDGGEAWMPLGKHEWTSRYAWVVDRFGVSWQLDVDDIRSDQKVVPNLLFGQHQKFMVKEAIHGYANIFPDSKILMEAPFSPQTNIPEGSLLFAQVKLNGFILNAMSSMLDQELEFNPGISIVIECESQAQIDHYWENLGENGRYNMCGWLEDKFGVSWQVVPAKLGLWMSDPQKAPKVVEAFMKMQKFEISTLENITF